MSLEDLEQEKEAIESSHFETLHQCKETIKNYIARYGFVGEEILDAFQYFGHSPQYLIESDITMDDYVIQVLSYIIKEYEEENGIELEDNQFMQPDGEIITEEHHSRSELMDLEERD